MLESFQRKDELQLFNRMSHFCETEEEETVARNVSVELIGYKLVAEAAAEPVSLRHF